MTNLSDEPWQLKAGTSVGVHLRFQLFNDVNEQIQVAQVAGVFPQILQMPPKAAKLSSLHRTEDFAMGVDQAFSCGCARVSLALMRVWVEAATHRHECSVG